METLLADVGLELAGETLVVNEDLEIRQGDQPFIEIIGEEGLDVAEIQRLAIEVVETESLKRFYDLIWIFGNLDRAFKKASIYINLKELHQVDALIRVFQETGQTWPPKQKGETNVQFNKRSKIPMQMLERLREIYPREQVYAKHSLVGPSGPYRLCTTSYSMRGRNFVGRDNIY